MTQTSNQISTRSVPRSPASAFRQFAALEDDLDGGPADETVRFAIGGAAYQIDLNKKNARAFRKQLAPFVEHARKAGRGLRRPRSSSTRRRSGDIGPGASQQGIAVSDRGRIPTSVVAQYDAATGRS